MSHLINPAKSSSWLLPLGLLVIATTDVASVSAHKVKVAADVGGTLHVEPNDHPQAGKAALTWVALTRRGGQAIPLEQCNCQLAVYPQPHAEGSPALLKPPLKAVSTEGYQGVPGAEIVFPQPGAYQLELSGTPKAGASFKPFQLNYQVTVAAGTTAPATPLSRQQPSQVKQDWQTNAIAIAIFLGLGIFVIGLRRSPGKNR